ncbi:uncharacterized protein LOC122955889 [Acropora millepora]|uniref:uncharacterized protein LOC122955889 n=1 Tax=Acropora millepora TaxID=45264 RepID=UPI001CF3997B|nr:uncharacterized protein LOC122955889 [Acropora millepora]
MRGRWYCLAEREDISLRLLLNQMSPFDARKMVLPCREGRYFFASPPESNVGVLEKTDQVSFTGLLESQHSRTLEPQVSLEVLGKFLARGAGTATFEPATL